MNNSEHVCTPYIGANGNWHVDSKDTGPQGEKGDTPELISELKETAKGKALDATSVAADENFGTAAERSHPSILLTADRLN